MKKHRASIRFEHLPRNNCKATQKLSGHQALATRTLQFGDAQHTFAALHTHAVFVGG
jgi:hypothetical protein